MNGNSASFDFSDRLPEALRSTRAVTGLVLGSGLSGFVDGLEVDGAWSYDSIEGLPVSSVPGHPGRIVSARIGTIPVIIAQGRVHLYEGRDAHEVVRMIDLFHAIGLKHVVLTNAAGAVNPEFAPGSWMMLSDHLNLTGHSPLRGGPHFVDLSEVYSRRIRSLFLAEARASDVTLHEGIYAAVPGPQYETPAEIRMLRVLGADAVGMSTVPEAIRARAHGLEVAGFSCLTNWGAGLSGDVLSHDEVTVVGRQAADVLARLLRAVLPQL